MASNRKAIERVFIVCRYKTVPSPSYIANSIYYDLGFRGWGSTSASSLVEFSRSVPPLLTNFASSESSMMGGLLLTQHPRMP